jgi:hypothetical protein
MKSDLDTMTNAARVILEACQPLRESGKSKAFIITAWEAYRLNAGSRITLDAFKSLLLELRGHLQLTRCAMPVVYDDAIVEASEIRLMDGDRLITTFHFIELS